MGSLSDKKIAFIIAPHDFRDEEYFQPKVILQAKGAQVSTVAKGDPEEVTGSKGGKAHTDALMADVNPQTYDAIVLVGGPGVKEYFNDKTVLSLVKSFASEGKVIGAICSAPTVLANAGVLDGKKVTSYEKDRPAIEEKGVTWTPEEVIVDQNIVTATGPEVAIRFGEKVAEALSQ